MRLLKRMKIHFDAFLRYFERKNFRDRVREEKTKKYLVAQTSAKKSAVLFETGGRGGKFRFASTVYAKIREESDAIRMVSISVAGVLLVLSGYLVFGSTYFRISPAKVVIERLDAGSDVNIAYKSIEEFYGAPIFSIDSSAVSSAIIAMQKNIREARVSRLYPNGLKIIISSWPPEFVTYFPALERYYGVTGNGILIYARNRNPELPEIAIVDPDLVETGFLDYREGIAEEPMVRMIALRDAIKEVLPGIVVSKYAYFRLEQEVHVSLDSGTRLIFSLDGTDRRQLSTLVFWNSQEGGILAK
jgi:hypothetical protein